MLCEDIMKRELECVTPGDSAQDAACRMRDCNVGFLPVCDATKKVLGTLTDRDITVRLVAAGKLGNTRVEEIMSREAIACRPQDDLQSAERLMASHQKSRILCIDERGQLAGIISLSDLAKHAPSPRASQTLRQVTEREARA